MDTTTLSMVKSRTDYGLWKSSVERRYRNQLTKLPVLDLDCRVFENNYKRPSLFIRNQLYAPENEEQELYWLLSFLKHREDSFPDFKLLVRKARTSCHEAISNMSPKCRKSSTFGNHWFKVTSTSQALMETESSSFLSPQGIVPLLQDNRLTQALLDLKVFMFYVLDKFLENYTTWEKEEEIPEIHSTCAMYFLHSETPRFTLGCNSNSTLEWFLVYLTKHMDEFPEYQKQVLDAERTCNDFSSAVLHDLVEGTGCSELDAPEKKMETQRVKYPDDCQLLVHMEDGNFDARKRTISPRFDRPIQWPIALRKNEFKAVRNTMKSIVSCARRTFMERRSRRMLMTSHCSAHSSG